MPPPLAIVVDFIHFGYSPSLLSLKSTFEFVDIKMLTFSDVDLFPFMLVIFFFRKDKKRTRNNL